jgi:hypothetical protein
VRFAVALPPADPEEGLCVVLWSGADVSPQFRNRQLIIRVKPPDALPPGPAEPLLVKLAGWDQEVAVVKVVLKPSKSHIYRFHYIARWDSYHGWRESIENIREGQRAAASAFLLALGRGLVIGRPPGSGTFRDTDDFLDRVTGAIDEYRRANDGRDPNEPEIAKRFNVTARTIRRWTRKAEYPSWAHMLAAV